MISVVISLCLARVTHNTCYTSIYSILVGCARGCEALNAYTAQHALNVYTAEEGWYIPGCQFLKKISEIQIPESGFMKQISLKSIKNYLAFLFWFLYVQDGKFTQKGETSKTS